MSKPIDIVATWPKDRPLGSYLEGLAKAREAGAVINFRVANRPYWEFGALRDRPARCYMVHDGLVRGYNHILSVTYREAREVIGAEGGFWPPGQYVVRDPAWHALEVRLPMRGFQGWRWFDLEQALAELEGHDGPKPPT